MKNIKKTLSIETPNNVPAYCIRMYGCAALYPHKNPSLEIDIPDIDNKGVIFYFTKSNVHTN